MSRKIWNQWNRFWDDCVCSEYKYLHHFFSDFPFPSGKMMAKPRIQFQFCVSVHHIMINKNTSLMQLISIYFTYSRSLHVSGRTLPISSPTTQPLPHSNIFYPLDASSTSFNGLIPIADMYSIIFSWWWAVSCPKHVETYCKWNIYLLAASSWCSYLSLYDARKHNTEIQEGVCSKQPVSSLICDGFRNANDFKNFISSTVGRLWKFSHHYVTKTNFDQSTVC